MILEQKITKNFFDLKFSLFRPKFRGKSHFHWDETRDAQVSAGYGWYQIVRWPKAFNSSYKRDFRVGKLTSGGQLSEKIGKTTPSSGENNVINIYKYPTLSQQHNDVTHITVTDSLS